MSPYRQSLVSLVVIVLALGVAAVAWRMAPPPPPPPGASLEPVFDFAAGDVRAIDLDTWQGRLVARRADGHWSVEQVRLGRGASAEGDAPQPTQPEIDRTLDNLVSELVSTPQIDRFVPDGQSMRDFGLDPPQAWIALELEGGARRTLELGELTITTSALYARVLPSPDVFQIGSLVFNNVAAALFRLRALAPADAGTEGGT